MSRNGQLREPSARLWSYLDNAGLFTKLFEMAEAL